MCTGRNGASKCGPVHLAVPEADHVVIHKQGQEIRLRFVLTTDLVPEADALIFLEMYIRAHLALGHWAVEILRVAILPGIGGFRVIALHFPCIDAVIGHGHGLELQSSAKDVQRFIQRSRRCRLERFHTGRQGDELCPASLCGGDRRSCCRNGNADERHQHSDYGKYGDGPFHKKPPLSRSHHYERS